MSLKPRKYNDIFFMAVVFARKLMANGFICSGCWFCQHLTVSFLTCYAIFCLKKVCVYYFQLKFCIFVPSLSRNGGTTH